MKMKNDNMKKEIKISEVKSNPNNPRVIKGDKFDKLKNSIKTLPGYMELRPIILDKDMMVLGGNMRLKASIALGKKEIWSDVFTEEMSVKMNLQAIKDGREEKTYLEYCKEIIIKDNTTSGEWEWDVLANEWNTAELDVWGLDVWQNEDDIKEEPKDFSDDLKETFEVIVSCGNEEEQEETFNYLTKKNYICRVLTL
tara:strand:+ start:1027 stop:1617 length:591 start_codon:yes stop_codon:yes gene_type:complete